MSGFATGNGHPSARIRLGEVLRRYNEIVHPGDRPSGKATFVGLEHIESGTGRRIGSAIVNFEEMTGRKPLFRQGQIVYGYLRPYLNKVWVADFDGCSSVDQFAFDVDGRHAHTDYLAAFLRSETFLERAAKATTPGQLPRISIDDIESVELDLPPLSEQRRIARRLAEQMESIQRARAAAVERLAAAQTLPAAYLREVFGSAPPFSALVLRPSEPTRPGWRWHLLTDLARLATGHTPSRREPRWWGGDVRWLQLPDIRAVDGRRVFETSEQTNELGIANSAAVLLPAGTVCMSRTASVGFVTIMGRDMATSQDFVNWVCGADLDPEFLMYLILRCRREIRELGSGATHHTIYFETVQNLSICVPAIDEQKGFVAELARRLSGTELIAAALREQVCDIDALPAALLREAFEGNH